MRSYLATGSCTRAIWSIHPERILWGRLPAHRYVRKGHTRRSSGLFAKLPSMPLSLRSWPRDPSRPTFDRCRHPADRVATFRQLLHGRDVCNTEHPAAHCGRQDRLNSVDRRGQGKIQEAATRRRTKACHPGCNHQFGTCGAASSLPDTNLRVGPRPTSGSA